MGSVLGGLSVGFGARSVTSSTRVVLLPAALDAVTVNVCVPTVTTLPLIVPD